MPALPPSSREAASLLASRRPPPSLTAIRRRFLTQGDVAGDLLPGPILRSWQRCAALGLRMDMRPAVEPLGRADLGERHDRSERLRAAAGTELGRLHAEVGRSSGVVILTDADGVVLERLGDGDFADKAERVALRPGVAWAEATTGTNAIGTAIAERREITVVGGEHFFESHRILSCTAAPIVGADGETLGVLDLSDRADGASASNLALVRRAVVAIERHLFLEAAAGLDLVAVHGDHRPPDDVSTGLLALSGDRLVAVDRTALALLDLEREAIAGRRWSEVFDRPRPAGDSVARLLTLRGKPCFGRIHEPRPATVPGFRPTPIEAPVAPSRDTRAPNRRREIVWDETRTRALLRATRLVDADVPVLIQGETGTGKEVFARALHAASRRRGGPFVAVNCAALPETLIEAELFGYEEGAFTGARRKGSKGLMREADGGILFLDEIGDMPLALQARLLRALEEREVTPLGGGRPIPVDFALVCATHMGLPEAVERRAFRQDLYFRIAQYTVELPPLRGRADLREVVERLWNDHAVGDARLAPDTVDHLAAHDWPGNFRQLTATLRTLAILAEPDETLEPDALPADFRRAARTGAATDVVPPGAGPTTPTDLAGLGRAAIREALAACDGNVTRAAERLGIHRATLYRRLRAERAADEA